jgi:hypothetical protein
MISYWNQNQIRREALREQGIPWIGGSSGNEGHASPQKYGEGDTLSWKLFVIICNA